MRHCWGRFNDIWLKSLYLRVMRPYAQAAAADDTLILLRAARDEMFTSGHASRRSQQGRHFHALAEMPASGRLASLL